MLTFFIDKNFFIFFFFIWESLLFPDHHTTAAGNTKDEEHRLPPYKHLYADFRPSTPPLATSTCSILV